MLVARCSVQTCYKLNLQCQGETIPVVGLMVISYSWELHAENIVPLLVEFIFVVTLMGDGGVAWWAAEPRWDAVCCRIFQAVLTFISIFTPTSTRKNNKHKSAKNSLSVDENLFGCTLCTTSYLCTLLLWTDK